MNENIIEVKNLTKIYEDGNVLAVDNISFSIRKGEIFALLGPNGAGKTTTISMLATLLFPTKGKAIVNSFDVEKESHNVRKSIGIVFQEPSLDGEMTGWENLELHGILYGMPKKQRRNKIKEMLKLVDLEDKADMFVKNYSGGMKRRLEIARGLLHEPRILFLDEPTLGLDPQTRRKIWEKIRELNKELKITILLTTHYMEEADELADRICIMDHGKIIALDTSENLKRQISGDIIDIELEKINEKEKIRSLIKDFNALEGVRNVSLGSSQKDESNGQPAMKFPPHMNPSMVQARLREITSDPKKFVNILKKFPMASQMFVKAPLDVKKRVANVMPENLIDQLPEEIKDIILKIKSGEYKDIKDDNSINLSISCEKGGKILPELIQIINKFGLKIKAINMHQPKLEDVFLHFVGEEIREESSDRVSGIKRMIQMRQLRR
ncbi:MAG: ATP-binding cassette domain-containing protein [Promethearchaeota archaeon]